MALPASAGKAAGSTFGLAVTRRGAQAQQPRRAPCARAPQHRELPCSIPPPFPSPASNPPATPSRCSRTRCRARTACRSPSCWRRPVCPTRRTACNWHCRCSSRASSARSIPTTRYPPSSIPTAPGGKPPAPFESGAIPLHLAEKTEELLPAEPAARYTVIEWLTFQIGGVGPMFGPLGFVHCFAGRDIENKRPRDRCVAQAKSLLGVLEGQLGPPAWVTGRDYSIAEAAIFP